jgi:hypothetical protein
MPSLSVAPQGFVRGGSVGALFGDHLPVIQRGILDIVRRSFATRPMRNITGQAIAERTHFCVGKAAELRRTLRWGTERIIDELPAALSAYLDHKPWEPSKRVCWVPSDGN